MVFCHLGEQEEGSALSHWEWCSVRIFMISPPSPNLVLSRSEYEVLMPKATKYLTLQMWYGTLGYFGDAAVGSSCVSGTCKASSDNVLLLSEPSHCHLPQSWRPFHGVCRTGTFATVLARRNIRCEERPEGIGSVITLHLCQVHSSNAMQMGSILNKSLSLSKDTQMFRWPWTSYLAFLSLRLYSEERGLWWC